MAFVVRRQRDSALHPKRKVLRMGQCGLLVRLSPEDRDLCQETWYLHPNGYAFRRQRKLQNGRLVCVGVVWLHREIAKRICHARGMTLSSRVRFLNHARLDCRRENLRVCREKPSV